MSASGAGTVASSAMKPSSLRWFGVRPAPRGSGGAAKGVKALLVISAGFVAIWVYCFIKGRQIDALRAAAG